MYKTAVITVQNLLTLIELGRVQRFFFSQTILYNQANIFDPAETRNSSLIV